MKKDNNISLELNLKIKDDSSEHSWFCMVMGFILLLEGVLIFFLI